MFYQQLIAEHFEIDRIAARLEATVQNADADFDTAAVILNELARVIEEHLQHENSFIYPDLARSSDPAGADVLVTEFEALKRDWRTYLDTWQEAAIAERWSSFCADSAGMLERLRERVMKETSLLYGTALREGLIVLRSPDAS